MYKYPRTQHIEGSRLQAGDEDLEAVPFDVLAGRHVVVEEKVDGANCGLSFGADGALRLQSRGHYLAGGPRERHWDVLKTWARVIEAPLGRVLGERYVMYGEWLYAKHTVYYDALPHWLLEFDVLDSHDGTFLSTPRRRELLGGLPIRTVPVLYAGRATTLEAMLALIGPSRFKRPGWRARLEAEAAGRGLDVERVLRETDSSDLMEGLYIKVEEDGVVKERYKWIRAGFLAAVFAAEGHWLARPIVPNRLDDGVDIYDLGDSGDSGHADTTGSAGA